MIFFHNQHNFLIVMLLLFMFSGFVSAKETPSIESAFASTTTKITTTSNAVSVPVDWAFTNHSTEPLAVEKFDESCGCLSGQAQLEGTSKSATYKVPMVPSNTVPLKTRIPSANQWFIMVNQISKEWEVKYAVENSSDGTSEEGSMVITVKKDLPSFGDIMSFPGHIGIFLGHDIYVSSTAGTQYPEQNSDQLLIKPVPQLISRKWIVPSKSEHR